MGVGLLTPRQGEILALLRDGYIAKEAAFRLGTSVLTVKKQVVDARGRLGALNTTHAVVIAVRRGCIDLG